MIYKTPLPHESEIAVNIDRVKFAAKKRKELGQINHSRALTDKMNQQLGGFLAKKSKILLHK